MERVLSDEQLEAFDVDFIDRFKWNRIKDCIGESFPASAFSVLDVGCGNGVFADKIIAEYPESRVTGLDMSEMLLAKNRPHPRKRTILGSALVLSDLAEQYDLICFNWLLHHLVDDTHAASLANVCLTLSEARNLLTERGRVSVYENMFDGILVDKAPGRIIYALTTIRWLSVLTRLGGANTGGVGVCFQSERQWRENFNRAGLAIESFHRHDAFERTALRNIIQGIVLHLRPMAAAHFWLRQGRDAAPWL